MKTFNNLARIRKEKGLTQQMLADKLNVTDRAISHWENGRSMPDVSLFKPLCEIFDISVNELISGERLSKDKLIKQSDENIIKTINAKNNQKKKTIKIIFLLIFSFLLIIMLLIFYNHQLKINLVNDSDYLYYVALDFLKEEDLKTNPDASNNDFNVFYSYHGFGIEQKNNYKYAYMWIYSQSYYIDENNSLVVSSSSSMPCKVTFKNNNVIDIDYPKDGIYYKKSIKEIFPDIIANQVLNFDKNKNIDKLFNDINNKVKTYYDYLNLELNELSIEDISYNNLIFSISLGNKICVPVSLSIFQNNNYVLYTDYEECKPNQNCTSILKYTKSVKGTYNFDIMQIIKHSTDASNMQFSNSNLPKYEIYTGNGYYFITDNDNKYLMEFLNTINVDLNKCAEPDYKD